MPNDQQQNFQQPEGILNTAYEDALLGFILADPDKMLEVSEILPFPDFFTQPKNRTAWEIFLKLFREDHFPGSPALMTAELHNRAKGQFPTEMEALNYVSHLLDAPSSGAKKFNPKSFAEYAEHIRWERDKRRLSTIADEIKSASATTSVMDKEEFLSSVEDQIAEITMSVHGKESLQHISEITGPLEEQLARLRRGEKLGSGVMTGIDNLDKTLNGLKGGELIVLAARPSLGKANAADTLMPCYNADQNCVEIHMISELEIGDYVYNRHGKPVMVTGVFPQGKLDAYKLTFSDGRTAICSADHIWPYIQRTHEKGKRVEKIFNKTLQDMLDVGIIHIKPNEVNDPTRRNRSRFAMPINAPVEFPERKHKIDPYVMGVFLGDGCKNNSGVFELSSEFEAHVKDIAERLGAVAYKKSNMSYTWHFYSHYENGTGKRLYIDEIDSRYTELLSDTYCGDKYIPEEYLYDSIENRWKLLRGLMDTDGSAKQKAPWRHPLVFSTTSEILAYDFRSLCNSLGIIAHICVHDRTGQTQVVAGKTYTCKSVEYNVQILVPNSLKPAFFTLPHKLERAQAAADAEATGTYKNRTKYDRIQLKKVEKLPEPMEMVCISVDDPEELYLCNDYLVTHNTTLSMQIAYNVSQTLTDEKPNAVLIFSLEMMEDQLMSRMVATSGRINMKSFMDEFEHYIDDHYYARAYSKNFEQKMQQKLDLQFQRAEIALDHVKSLPIYTTTEPGMTPNSIKSLVMQKKREIEKNGQHLALVVIDYLQLMIPSLAKANASRTEEVGDMSRKMKLLAKEFDVPVLLLAQLNRNADVTERPNLKDLRESGSIEQDADKVMFIWSENNDKSPSDFAEYREDAARVEALRREQMKVTITVAKNRQGESGDCPVIFDKGFQTFVSQSDEYAANNEQYEEFAAKYYQKTRTDDLFWPLRPGEIPEELERFRKPIVREVPYLSPSGNLVTLMNDDGLSHGEMHVQSNPITPASQDVSAARAAASHAASQYDQSEPDLLPVIDDLGTEFEEMEASDFAMASDKGEAEGDAPNLGGYPSAVDGGFPAGTASRANSDGTEETSALADDSDITIMGDDSDIEFDDDEIDLDSLDLLDSLSEELAK